MRHRSVTRGLVECAILALAIGAVVAGRSSLGAAGDESWAPVVVLATEPGSALPRPTPSRAAPAPEPPPRLAKASPAHTRPVAVRKPVSPLLAQGSEPEPKAADVPAEVGTPAQRPGASAAGREPEAAPKSVEASSGVASPAQQYCANIADAAADARFAWQKKALTEVQKETAARTALLEAKIAEIQKWLARREEFSKKANQSLVNIYSRMRPDAAASQLVKMEEETAAAVLLKLDPRSASAILNEIPPAQAARLAGTISGAARIPQDGKKS